MIVLSNSTEQTLLAGQSLTFDLVPLRTGCAESHRVGTGSVRLRYPGVYDIHFSANVGGTVANTPVQLAIELGGDVLRETTMISTPSAADVFNNVAKRTYVKNCPNDYDRITVTNTGTSDVVVAPNASLTIGRLSG